MGTTPSSRAKLLDQPKKDVVSLTECANDLEVGLSAAMMIYRERAEEALSQHMCTMDALQNKHDLEIATLKAENSKLRGLLGLAVDSRASDQQLLFQANDPAPI